MGLSRKGKYLAVAMPFGNKKTSIEDDLSESAKEKKPINQQHVLKVYSRILLLAKKQVVQLSTFKEVFFVLI